MKYYLYISDAKLDMLAAPIPQGIRERLVAELKIDLKVLSVSLRDNPSEETRYSKLDAVTAYIDSEEVVGTVDDPEPYFRGHLSMKWGPLGKHITEVPPVVYFTGETEATVVGLGGSAAHVVGAPSQVSAEGFVLPSSSVAALIRVMAEETAPERQIDIMEAVQAEVWPSFAQSLLKWYDSVPQDR